MQEFHVDVPTPDGLMECFAAHPDGPGPFAPVILYMDVPGIREELRNMARRFAENGYFCLLPDLYYRHGKVRFDLSKGPEELQRMFAVGRGLSNAMVMRDTQGMLDYLKNNPLATDRTGIVGHCMSGQFVVSAAGTYPARIAAAVSFYGTLIVTDKPDSPHKLAPSIEGELYLAFAEHDPYVEDNVIPELRAALEAASVRYRIETYPGTDHGFCFPERPAYSEEAAERGWAAVFELYERTLR